MHDVAACPPLTYQALKSELSAQPALLEASVFGYDDIYRLLQPYVAWWRVLARAQPGSQVAGGGTAGL